MDGNREVKLVKIQKKKIGAGSGRGGRGGVRVGGGGSGWM